MRIALNARILVTQQIRGWSRYTINLLEGLLASEHEVYLFSDQPINQKLIPHAKNFCQIHQKPGINYIDWEQRILPGLCAQHQIDVLHCPVNYGLPLISKTKKVLTLHDAIEKVFYDGQKSLKDFVSLNHWKMRGLHYLSQKAADVIITVSEHAKQDIIRAYGVPADKIKVIYEAADKDFCQEAVIPWDIFKSSFKNIQQPYFLYVGGLELRKNIKNLLQAWRQAGLTDFSLVIGGGSKDEQENFKSQSREMGIEPLFLGYVPQNLLPSLYAHAHSFIYPSMYEGFGLQVVEAMSLGTPVLCSNVTSLPEVLGDKDCVFDPKDVLQMAQQIQKMTHKDFHQSKKQKVILRSQEFSWNKNVEQTIKLYEELNDV